MLFSNPALFVFVDFLITSNSVINSQIFLFGPVQFFNKYFLTTNFILICVAADRPIKSDIFFTTI